MAVLMQGLTLLLVALSLGAAPAPENGTAVGPPDAPACEGAGCNASAVLRGPGRSSGPERAAAGEDEVGAQAAGAPHANRSRSNFLATSEDCAHPCMWILKGCDPNEVCTLGCCKIVVR